ncbi:putative pyridoxal phosphate-dependent acyltransferase [Candidatus Brocadiaceae bacterium B188]|nr:glycine C-acetyltransferase [Candidatus Brocadia sapporoensis]MEB2307743.1 glycine C-acetyltransferase [Candidatus Brocadiaceae bacterium]QQR66996.1 MAG: glycine C-acetyltransferase [Candidatus Brocadia sp.]RZV58287.1 MAG: glycine C-acetyltransferase [Candidatus Brocadia sp. BROELEC01]TWU53992.1 putative pyridoxal phosphate-dependent acyltransferase [Candidatus Brocadiaceae bacterium B188]
MMDKLNFLIKELDKLKETELLVHIRTIEGPQRAWIIVDGKKVFNLCSNNYLGFANNPQLKSAAQKAIETYGVGPASVRTIAGTTALHKELERKLALFKGVESALSFQSGFCANLAVIPAIVGEDDAVFSDELNHASIIDGCRLSRAKVIRYEHGNARDLQVKMSEERNARRKLIITDGVFSMEGDIAPLPEIVEIAENFGAIIMVDDAHGEGVLGQGGRGIADHFNLHGKIDIEVGTLSKAFGVVGGYIAGSKRLTDYLAQRGRPFLFSSAVTAADVAACIAAVDILTASDLLVKQLWDNTVFFQQKMKQAGFNIGQTKTPITPVILGDVKIAREFSQRLFDEGIFSQAIGYPTVPMGKARIRVMISAAHGRDDLAWAAERFERIGKLLGIPHSK